MSMGSEGWSRAWREAWAQANEDFYSREQPAAHFRTSASDASVMAPLIAGMIAEADSRLGQPREFTIVDVGAGDGSLLAAIGEHVRPDMRLIAVDLRPRPLALSGRVEWVQGLAPDCLPHDLVGAMLALEWLDDIACDVIEYADVPRLVLVDDDGIESLGPALADEVGCALHGVDSREADEWLRRWWPLERGERAEVGSTRDRAWTDAVSRLSAGLALAVDYSHERSSRRPTMTAYVDGREALPVPDGSRNITAHVAIDSLADAIHEMGEVSIALQRDVIPHEAPSGGLAGLQRAGAIATLRDPWGLGSHRWLRVDMSG